MKRMQLTDEEWSQLKRHLEGGGYLESALIVSGSSKDIATNVQALLENCTLPQYSIRYYLCSGSQIFCVPCYEPFVSEERTCEPPGACHVLEHAAGLLTPEPATYSPRYAHVELQKSIREEKSRLPLILIEWITPPARNDITFFQLALISLHDIPVIIFLHLHDDNDEELQGQEYSAAHELLLLLYMCGGRVREAEWRKLGGQCLSDPFAEGHKGDQQVTSRQMGPTQLVCYADRRVAERAERLFRKLTPEKRKESAKRILHALPGGSGYPIFALSCQLSDSNDILSKYSLKTLKTAFSEPVGVLRYFRHLRRVARRGGDSALAAVASINYIASLLCIDSIDVTRIYRKLQQADFSDIDNDATARLWFTLGQALSRAKDQQAWEYAFECYRRSRTCLEVTTMQQGPRRSHLAAIANGEALLALKLRQREQARTLEESALAELRGVGQSPDIIIQQVLLITNLGEVQYRMFKDTEAAIAHYQAAYTLALSCPTPEARGYVVPKLAEALTQAKRSQEAVGILHDFLLQLRQTPGTSPLTDTIATLKTLLMLAQAYQETGRQRSATACYWLLLRHPQQLTLAVLKGIIANLLRCRPGIRVSLQARIRRILAEQEEIMADVACLQGALSAMR